MKEELEDRLDCLKKEKQALMSQMQDIDRKHKELDEQAQNISKRLFTLDGSIFEVERLKTLEEGSKDKK